MDDSWDLFLDAEEPKTEFCQCKKNAGFSLFLTGVYLEIADECSLESLAAQLQSHTESYLYIRNKKLGFYTQLPSLRGYRVVNSHKAFGTTIYTLQRGNDTIVCFSSELKDHLIQ